MVVWDEEALAQHELGLDRILLDLCPPGETFLDVGAHLGKYAVALATAGREVIAVEPNPESAALLYERMKASGLDFLIVEAIAWNSYSFLSMVVTDDSGSTRFVEDPPGDRVGMPLDDLLIGPFRLVKIDVEGAELRVLQGMVNLTRRWHPTFLIELHDQIFPDIGAQVRDWFSGLGYRVEVAYTWEGSEYLLAE